MVSHMSDPTRIRVGEGGESDYDVVIGSGLLGNIAGLVDPGVQRVLVRSARSCGPTPGFFAAPTIGVALLPLLANAGLLGLHR